MSASNAFHLSTTAAEAYENQKVPSVLRPLAEATLDAISRPIGSRLIDIACGTGIIPKLLVERLSGERRIVGTDLNPAMIEVARRTMPRSPHTVDWFACDVAELPLGDAEFDVAFCQQGLQFFPDKPAGLSEIRRVLAPEGRLILTCWGAISPLFQAIADSLKARVSERSASQALSPFSLRDGDVIASLLTDAGFRIVETSSLLLHRKLRPARAAIREDILTSPYEGELREKGDATIELVVADVHAALAQYRRGEDLVIPLEAHLFQAEKTSIG